MLSEIPSKHLIFLVFQTVFFIILVCHPELALLSCCRPFYPCVAAIAGFFTNLRHPKPFNMIIFFSDKGQVSLSRVTIDFTVALFWLALDLQTRFRLRQHLLGNVIFLDASDEIKLSLRWGRLLPVKGRLPFEMEFSHRPVTTRAS